MIKNFNKAAHKNLLSDKSSHSTSLNKINIIATIMYTSDDAENVIKFFLITTAVRTLSCALSVMSFGLVIRNIGLVDF